MRISEEFLSELRSRIDIDDLIGQYVELKRQGRIAKGLCPFHSEKTPSFTVYPETQSYYCFGCGRGGDAVTFIRDIENLDYLEAVRMLAERAGLNMPEDNFDDELNRKRRRMLEMNREAARFFHQYMMSPQGKAGLDYFRNRGLSQKTINHFGLGYAPNEWHGLINYMAQKGYSKAELYEANLAKKSQKGSNINYYDNFRNRAITPIIDLRGNVIAFGGRVLDDSKPKYVNTADTLVYKKSNAVFALNFAKQGNVGKLILAEGYMDVIALHQAGFTNAVAGLGTALTDEQVRLISRYCDEVILSYDSDEAGKKATKNAIAKFEKTGLRIKTLRLEGGKDPDEIIKKYGPDRFKALIEGAANDTEYKLLEKRNMFDLTTSSGKIGFLNEAALVLASLTSPIERDIYASRLSDELAVGKEAILLQVSEQIKKNRRREQKTRLEKISNDFVRPKDNINPERPSNLKAAKAEEILISSLMKNPDFYREISGKISPDDFVTDFNRRVFQRLAAIILNGTRQVGAANFSSDFSSDEMGRIVQLELKSKQLSNTIEECDDCINVLKQEKNRKRDVNPAEMTDEEFKNLFKQNT